VRKAARESKCGKDGTAAYKYTLATMHVGNVPAEEEKAARTERVRGDEPL
jgi:hypothetical protein